MAIFAGFVDMLRKVPIYKNVDEVAFHQTRAHGAGRNLKRFGNEGTQYEYGQDNRKKAGHIIAEMIFVIQSTAQYLLSFFIHRGRLPGLERQLAPQPNRAGKYDKHQ